MPRPLSDEDLAGFRERLIDVAEKLFAQHGLEAVTMRQLAGVTARAGGRASVPPAPFVIGSRRRCECAKMLA